MTNYQPPRKPSACIPCHERKVRCDSALVGVPCSRCVSKNREGYCALATRVQGSSNKRSRDGSDRNSSPQRRYRTPPATNTENTASWVTNTKQNGSLQSERQLSGDYSFNITASNQLSQGLNLPPEVPQNKTNSSDNQGLMRAPTPPVTNQAIGLENNAISGYGISDVEGAVQTLCRMSDEASEFSTPHGLSASTRGQHTIQYFDRLNSITMLGEVLGRRQRRRLIRIDLPGPKSTSAKQREMSGLEPTDIAYIKQKKIYDFPPKSVCYELLSLFFDRIYPYMPILDPAQLLRDYNSDNCSTFLLYSILSNVVPHASSELLQRAGHVDRISAQRDFFSRARLLYDFGCEKGQLSLLQGSVLLSTFQFSFASDKDYRFWFHNAVRIATQMGLHRHDIGEDLDPSTHKLCRRLWWLLFQRDVLFSITGVENVRRMNDVEADTTPLTIDDWKDETIPGDWTEILRATTNVHKHYFIENCKLASLGAQFLRLFRFTRDAPSFETARGLAEDISKWRSSLPEVLLTERVSSWSSANVWIIVLLAMSYRFECVFYRTFREKVKGVNEEAANWSNHRLLNSILELDNVFNKAIVNDLVHLCPSSLIVCASNLLAFQIEIALDRNSSLTQKVSAKARIFAGLSYLRDIRDKWQIAKWTLRVFEWVTERAGLSITDVGIFDTQTLQSNAGLGVQNVDHSFNFSPSDRPFELMEDLPDHWVQDFIGEGLLGRYEGEFWDFG